MAPKKKTVADQIAVLKKTTEIIGIFSPLGRCLKTSFALTLGQILAKERAVLYLNMEEYSGFEELMGKGFATMVEFHKRVLEAKQAGADFIKIMTTGILDFNEHGAITGTPLDGSEVKEMVHIAHEEGMAVMSHTNGDYGVQAAVAAGVDSLEHGNYMNEESLAMLAESDTVWVPTLITVRNLLGDGRYDDETLKPIIESAEENIRKAFRLGIKTAPGSDAGAYRVLHGKGIRDEVQSFVEILGDQDAAYRWLAEGEAEIKKKFTVTVHW